MSNSSALPDFITSLRASLQDQSFVKLSLAQYGGTEEGLKNIYAKKILIKREEKLSFTYRYKTRDIVKNYAPDEAIALIEHYLGKDFGVATLLTTSFDLAFDGKKNILKKTPASHTEAPSLDHDRAKTRLIAAEGQSYLQDLGITDAKGEVLKASQDKYKQINKYIEILSGLLKDISADRIKKIVDMGAGKGYLTFALYDYLANTMKIPAVVEGVEYRQDMVDLCNKIADQSHFEKLKFVQGTIENYDGTDASVLIALHACDMATDDAIAKGIKAGAELIVVAPCCHKQIRREIEKSHKHNDLDFLTRHGIFVERQAEMVTDGIRAMILEYFGYTIKVFEFISDVHTPKNVMIVGTKNPKAKMQDEKILSKIKAAKEYFGIETHHLEQKMGL